jgi:hypothetical protein
LNPNARPEPRRNERFVYAGLPPESYSSMNDHASGTRAENYPECQVAARCVVPPEHRCAALGATEIHCLGGFVVAEYYGLTRPTSGVDIARVRGESSIADVQRIGGKGRCARQEASGLTSIA